MKCYNCKTEINEESFFCSKCGSPQKFTDLVKRALDNDQEAITQLYKMTYNNVYQTICMSSGLSNDVIFDLIQNTYVKAFQKLSQLNEPEAFRGWIKVIARNCTVDYLRKKNEVTFSQVIPVDYDETIEIKDERTENLPEVVMDQKETTRLIGEILDGLSKEQRLVVSMYYFEELSIKEIASILNVSEGTVKSRLNYGRKKIEVGVKELEKKGTKLYGLAPIPFLLFLFKGQQVYAAEIPSTVVLQALQKGLSFSISDAAGDVAGAAAQETAKVIRDEAAKETAKTIGAGAVKKATKAAGKSALAKTIAGVATVAVVGAGAAGITSMNGTDRYIAGDTMSEAATIPLGERITGTIDDDEEDWYKFTTGKTPDAEYNASFINTTVNSRELYVDIFTEDEERIGHVIAFASGEAMTVGMHGMSYILWEENTDYYVRLTTYGRGGTDYSFSIKDPDSEITINQMYGDIINTGDTSQDKEIFAGTNQADATLIPFEVKVSGTVFEDRTSWFAFKTRDEEGVCYRLTFENLTEDITPLSVSICDEYGDGQPPGGSVQRGDGPVTLIKEDLEANTIYYIRLQAGDEMKFSIVIDTIEK